MVERYLNEHYRFAPPSDIPSTLLYPGFTYYFSVELCNFLGACGIGSQKVVVLPQANVPSVTILGGGSVLQMLAKQSFSLTALIAKQQESSQLSACLLAYNISAAATSFSTPIYTWNVAIGNTLLIDLISTSKNPTSFSLLPYSLQTGSYYTVTIQVDTGGNIASASAQVYVAQGQVVAKMAGGSMQSIRVNELSLLDRSGSCDEDVSPAVVNDDGSSSLTYSWSCMEVQPSLNSSCANAIKMTLYHVWNNAMDPPGF
jgi:hypothetical protein